MNSSTSKKPFPKAKNTNNRASNSQQKRGLNWDAETVDFEEIKEDYQEKK